jgi:hypothetical protein
MLLDHSDDLQCLQQHTIVLIFCELFKVFVLITVVNSQGYNGYSPLKVVSYWLVENRSQETISRAGQWQNMAEVDEINIFC